MVLMPVSSYPAASDDRSQAQALGEEKAELRNTAEEVRDSGLTGAQKRRMLDGIGDKITGTEREIRHKRNDDTLKRRDEALRQSHRRLREDEQRRDFEKDTAARPTAKLDVKA